MFSCAQFFFVIQAGGINEKVITAIRSLWIYC
jgi:hypothetical protein